MKLEDPAIVPDMLQREAEREYQPSALIAMPHEALGMQAWVYL